MAPKCPSRKNNSKLSVVQKMLKDLSCELDSLQSKLLTSFHKLNDVIISATPISLKAKTMQIAELESTFGNSKVFSYLSLLVNTITAHRKVDICFMPLWALMMRTVRIIMMCTWYVDHVAA
jgi:hypothetical protein